jgi:predicted nucleic acid-binding protein
MRVILDTSGWLASVVKNDVFHQRAADFILEKPELIVPETVFEELIALLQYRFNRKTAQKNGEALLGVGLYLLNQKEIVASWRFFCQTKPAISWVDATLAVISQKLDLPIFTFDRHFKSLKLKVLP